MTDLYVFTILHMFNGYINVVIMKYILQNCGFKYDYFTVCFTLKHNNNNNS